VVDVRLLQIATHVAAAALSISFVTAVGVLTIGRGEVFRLTMRAPA